MLRHRIRLVNTDEVFTCKSEDSVLRGMEQLCRKGIPVGCRNGGCGVCKVHVLSGAYGVRKMSRAVCSAEEEAGGQVLACRLYPQGDLDLRVVGKMARAVEARQARQGVSWSSGFMTSTGVSQPDEET